jgi:hypothetical protein
MEPGRRARGPALTWPIPRSRRPARRLTARIGYRLIGSRRPDPPRSPTQLRWPPMSGRQLAWRTGDTTPPGRMPVTPWCAGSSSMTALTSARLRSRACTTQQPSHPRRICRPTRSAPPTRYPGRTRSRPAREIRPTHPAGPAACRTVTRLHPVLPPASPVEASNFSRLWLGLRRRGQLARLIVPRPGTSANGCRWYRRGSAGHADVPTAVGHARRTLPGLAHGREP